MPIPASAPPATPRREFLGQLATAAAAVAGTACVGPATNGAVASSRAPMPAVAAPASASAAGPSPAPHWDDAWTSRLTGKHKAVFDAPQIADGTIVANAWVFLKSYTEVYSLADRDLSVVLVLRHAAIPVAVDDALWEKYELGKHAQLKDPATKKWARRNLFWKSAPDVESTPADFTLDALRSRGAILLGCGLAADRMTRQIATRTGQPVDAVMAEVRAHLLPGLELAHSGIFAVTRAQEAGCTYIRST